MTAHKRTPLQTLPSEPRPLAIIGAILAQGVIRLLERQEQLASRTEERVHAVVLTTKDYTHE